MMHIYVYQRGHEFNLIKHLVAIRYCGIYIFRDQEAVWKNDHKFPSPRPHPCSVISHFPSEGEIYFPSPCIGVGPVTCGGEKK